MDSRLMSPPPSCLGRELSSVQKVGRELSSIQKSPSRLILSREQTSIQTSSSNLSRESSLIRNFSRTDSYLLSRFDSSLSGGGPARPPARLTRKTPSSFSTASAPGAVQNGWKRQENHRQHKSHDHRATKSDHTTRRQNASDQNTYGVTSATQASRDHRPKQWASSWADAYQRNAASIPRADTKNSMHSRTTQASSDRASVADTEGHVTPRRTHGKPLPKRPTRPIIITRKSIVQSQMLQSVYNNRSFKKLRHSRILKQFEDIELKDVSHHNKEIQEKEKAAKESRDKQKKALKRLRSRFDEEQVQRFKTQYVTWKSVEHERRGRGTEKYGLPETIDDDELTKLVSRRREEAPRKKYRQTRTREENIKRFSKLLNPKLGPEPDGGKSATIPTQALLEGIDTIDLTSPRSTKDGAKAKKRTVRNVLGSARKLLSASNGMDAISEVSSIRDESDQEDDGDY
ncbi:uncharacterized protein LOC144446523 isoform X2 [Glandiceps talaboti]